MSTSGRIDPTNAELLGHIEQLQTRIQHQELTMRGELETMQEQHRVALLHLTKKIAESESKHMLKSGEPAYDAGSRRSILAARRKLPGWRIRRLGVGLSLAVLLLVTPSRAAVTHASYADGNTAYGDGALLNNTGTFDTALGVNALNHNTASQNEASGAYALYKNTSGTYETAVGYYALYSNTTGDANTAMGTFALSDNTTGANNTAVGPQALTRNTTGGSNTAYGYQTLFSNTTGSNNTALGWLSGQTLNIGNASTTGSNDTYIGYNSGPGVSSEINNATAIGANAVVSQSNAIVLGGTGPNTQRVGVGTSTPHSALQIAVGYMQYRAITGPPPDAACSTSADDGRTVVRSDGSINLYVCAGSHWVGK